MHHGTETNGTQHLDVAVIFLLDVLSQVGVAVLQTIPNGFGRIGPQAVNQLVFPCVASLCDGLVLRVDENSLDAGRAKLYTEDGLTRFNNLFCCHNCQLKCQLSII